MRRGDHPLFERLTQLGLALGEADTDRADLVRERTDLTDELARLEGVKSDIAAADTRLSELANAGVPKWAARLRDIPEAVEDLVPADWEDA